MQFFSPMFFLIFHIINGKYKLIIENIRTQSLFKRTSTKVALKWRVSSNTAYFRIHLLILANSSEPFNKGKLFRGEAKVQSVCIIVIVALTYNCRKGVDVGELRLIENAIETHVLNSPE